MESATRMREGDCSQIVEGDTQASDIMCLACEQYRDGGEEQFSAWSTRWKEGDGTVFHLDVMILRFLYHIHSKVSSRQPMRDM